MSGEKLYSSKEIKALLERATELQKQQGNAGEEGLTREELEQIAADSGIDPAFVRQAMFEQKSRGSVPEKKFHILGAPISLEVGTEVPYELSPEDWEVIVQETRRTFKKSEGTVQKLGNSLEWMAPENKFIQASLTATPSKKKTRFFVSTHFGKVAFFTYYLPTVLTLITFGGLASEFNLSGPVSFWVGTAALITVLSGVRYAFGRIVDAQKRKLEKMLSRFADILAGDEEDEELEVMTSSTEKSAGRISFQHEEDSPVEESSDNNRSKERS